MHCARANLGTYQGYVQRDIILLNGILIDCPRRASLLQMEFFSVDYSIEVCSAGLRVGRRYACVMVRQQGYHAHQLS